MVNYRYVCAKRSGKRSPHRQLLSIPNKSMTIKEMVARFVRHLPVNVLQKEPIYLDQSEMDLEKVGRMDFAEKHELANEMKARAEAQEADLKAQEEHATKKRKEADLAYRKGLLKDLAEKPLDNTLPVDTDLTKK